MMRMLLSQKFEWAWDHRQTTIKLFKHHMILPLKHCMGRALQLKKMELNQHLHMIVPKLTLVLVLILSKILKFPSALIASLQWVQFYNQCKQHLSRVAVDCLSCSRDPVDKFRRVLNALT
nr:hypothetical protein Iba_chr06dCG5810 [Ipomoea batatas]